MASQLEDRCPICLGSGEEPSYVLPCLHQFCYACILRWAESKPKCPLCKRRVSSILYTFRCMCVSCSTTERNKKVFFITLSRIMPYYLTWQ
uniref:RING-type E3 ubiquitin transferase n=1 Tax=Calidris pygmaea TaxID=425635 RepID=A0A8C3K6F7_9CHAR